MHESRGKQGGAVGAWLVVAFLFILFIFVLNKFGKSKDVVFNQQIEDEKISREKIFEELKNEKDGDLWGKYIQKIFEESQKNNTEARISTTDLSSQYQTELESRVVLPEESFAIEGIIVGDSFSEKSKYLNDFENLFIYATKKGVFSEAQIFAAQAAATGTVLGLSDYDRQTLLRLATEYELWGNAILKLDTPKKYEQKSLVAVQDIFQISYILKKIVQEEDQDVYVLWIAKYMQKAFDILGSRYVK